MNTEYRMLKSALLLRTVSLYLKKLSEKVTDHGSLTSTAATQSFHYIWWCRVITL